MTYRRAITVFIFMCGLLLGASVVEALPISGVGVSGGLNLAWQKWDSPLYGGQGWLPDRSSRGNAGLFVQFLHLRHFNLECDLTYLQKAGADKDIPAYDAFGNPTGSVDSWVHLDYLSLAPVARFKWQLWRLEPFVKIGPSVDLLLARSSQLLGETEDDFSGYDVSVLYGAGLGFELAGPLSVYAEFLHQPSLIPVLDEDHRASGGSTVKVKNDLMRIDVGLLLAL
jgi:hypothetical protein